MATSMCHMANSNTAIQRIREKHMLVRMASDKWQQATGTWHVTCRIQKYAQISLNYCSIASALITILTDAHE